MAVAIWCTWFTLLKATFRRTRMLWAILATIDNWICTFWSRVWVFLIVANVVIAIPAICFGSIHTVRRLANMRCAEYAPCYCLFATIIETALMCTAIFFCCFFDSSAIRSNACMCLAISRTHFDTDQRVTRVKCTCVFWTKVAAWCLYSLAVLKVTRLVYVENPTDRIGVDDEHYCNNQ